MSDNGFQRRGVVKLTERGLVGEHAGKTNVQVELDVPITGSEFCSRRDERGRLIIEVKLYVEESEAD